MRPELAWFLQARSDLRAALTLEAAGSDTCQVILHLQMCSEKLVKGYRRRAYPLVRTHDAVTQWYPDLVSAIINDQRKRDSLGGAGASRSQVTKRLDSLKRTLVKIEQLNPSIAARLRRNENCEYPWESTGPPPVGYPPARHKFGRAVGRAARVKVFDLLDRILRCEGA